ncbi:uncharacterized protein LOC126907383 isoform X12 [Daktulosphaira vitifoliae]|uniref:uncharacterized protein LOC126907383 isoform X12 n=1 Tax=Daktulosphaira vitifoliae TaxID=58002 RepID=UPI0021AA9FAC|nr:uncharacterized protein LOC126907383 isoform X12 [Daktulosphaira vitifoliae]
MKKIVEVLHQKNSQKRNMNYPVLLSLCLIVFTAYGIPINNRNEKHDNQIEEHIQPLAISVFGFHRNVPNDSNNLPSDDTIVNITPQETHENTTPHDTNDNMTPQDTSDD